MKPTKNRPAQRLDRMPGADISRKLQRIVTDIKEHGQANVTRLTVLKGWLEAPHRLRSFGIFIATEALREPPKTTAEAAELFVEARNILADVDVLAPRIPQAAATKLHARLAAFQSERKEMRWASVRIIHNHTLFLVESGLGLYLWRGDSSALGYRLAVAFCEHYDPRYGSGLNGPSVKRIKEIGEFVLTTEAFEKTGSKSIHARS